MREEKDIDSICTSSSRCSSVLQMMVAVMELGTKSSCWWRLPPWKNCNIPMWCFVGFVQCEVQSVLVVELMTTNLRRFMDKNVNLGLIDSDKLDIITQCMYYIHTKGYARAEISSAPILWLRKRSFSYSEDGRPPRLSDTRRMEPRGVRPSIQDKTT